MDYIYILFIDISAQTKQPVCDDEIRAVISPLTHRASLTLHTSDTDTHTLRLPIGTYQYDVTRQGQNCSTTVRVFGECFSQKGIRVSHMIKE